MGLFLVETGIFSPVEYPAHPTDGGFSRDGGMGQGSDVVLDGSQCMTAKESFSSWRVNRHSSG